MAQEGHPVLGQPNPVTVLNQPYMPPETWAKLQGPHVEGNRHDTMMKVAISLVGNRWPDSEVFRLIRTHFPYEDKTDLEINNLILHAHSKNPQPSTITNGNHAPAFLAAPPVRRAKKKVIPPLELCESFLGASTLDCGAAVESSPIPIPAFEEQPALLLSALYGADEKLNVVCKFTVNDKGKANPHGGGRSLTPAGWLDYVKEHGVPMSDAGAWVRLNPCGPGSGKDGAIMDIDVLAFRYLLVESDRLPVETQVALYLKWKLPVVAIIKSGGGSAHAWLRVDCADKPEYVALAEKILALIEPFGFDQSNKNPSRLSRLPGAVRKVKASGDGRQELLYLNPAPPPLNFEEFKLQVTPPFVSNAPMVRVVRECRERYEDLFNNRGNTGLRTGIPSFDADTGGLKRGNFVVVAAETNVGKSTLTLNIINQVLRDKKTVALFTLEMDSGEIADMLFSINYSVDRNCFNTGKFEQRELEIISSAAKEVAKLPLHIFDDPNITVDDVRTTCLKLKEEHDLALIVVDYLQLVSPPPLARDSREQQIAQIGRSLKGIAKECKVPLIAVSQLNEEGKIRESRAIAHDAHIVFLLEWNGDDLMLKVTKGRSIQKRNYPLNFTPKYCRMTEQAKFQDVPPPPSRPLHWTEK